MGLRLRQLHVRRERRVHVLGHRPTDRRDGDRIAQRVGHRHLWDFGNAWSNNCNGPTGQMKAIFFGTGNWGKGAGIGPWFMGDFEAGVWSGGSGASTTTNANLPSTAFDCAMGALKTNATNYAIRVGNANPAP
jgi:Alpha-L-arabinofuranosidase B, catalytic